MKPALSHGLSSIVLLAMAGSAMSQELYEARVFSAAPDRQLKYRLMIPKDYAATGTERLSEK